MAAIVYIYEIFLFIASARQWSSSVRDTGITGIPANSPGFPGSLQGSLIKMAPTLKMFGVVSRFLYSGGWQVWTGYVRCFSLVFVSMSSWRLAVRKRLEKSPKRLRKYPSHFPSSRGYSRGERGFWEEDWELNSTVHVCWRCWRRREGTIAAGLTEVWPILKLQEMHSG